MVLGSKLILVPVDFEEVSRRALDAAVELAQCFGSRLTIMHAYEIPTYAYSWLPYAIPDPFEEIEVTARKELSELLQEVQRKVPAATATFRRGSPAAEILAVINEQRPDLVVMGTHGRKGLGHLFLGSVAEKIVQLSPAPVLTVRGDATESVPEAAKRADARASR